MPQARKMYVQRRDEAGCLRCLSVDPRGAARGTGRAGSRSSTDHDSLPAGAAIIARALLLCVSLVELGNVFTVFTASRVIDELGIGEEDASTVAREATEHALAGRFHGSWLLLHPQHQAAVPLAAFAACPWEGDPDTVEALMAPKETVDMPLLGRAEGHSVSLVQTWDSVIATAVQESDFVVEVASESRWTMTSRQLASCQRAQCL